MEDKIIYGREKNLKAIIGLGNPGAQYEGTRHNTGFEVADSLNNLARAGSSSFKLNKRLFAEIAQTMLLTVPVLLAKPVTYMNDSGKAVLAIKNFYKLALKDFLIIHDDISLPLGKIRLQQAGGAGGQHGVESIIECLGGEKDFNRLKIGIGPDPGGDVRIYYVLQKFSVSELALLNKSIEIAGKAVFCWLRYDIDRAMNEFNGGDVQLS